MARSASAFVVAAVMIASGCMGSSSPTLQPDRTSAPSPSAPAQIGRVPSVGNSWIDAVIPRLHQAGLRISIPKQWTLNSFDGPYAIIVSPDAGTRVPLGTVVTLRLGSAVGSPWQRLGRHVVPSVAGTHLNQAMARIQAAGLPWDVHAAPLPAASTADLFAAYCVTSQTPGSGTVITVGHNNDQIHAVELHAKPC